MFAVGATCSTENRLNSDDVGFFDPSIVASQSPKVGEEPISVSDPLLLERSDAVIELLEVFGK